MFTALPDPPPQMPSRNITVDAYDVTLGHLKVAPLVSPRFPTDTASILAVLRVCRMVNVFVHIENQWKAHLTNDDQRAREEIGTKDIRGGSTIRKGRKGWNEGKGWGRHISVK